VACKDIYYVTVMLWFAAGLHQHANVADCAVKEMVDSIKIARLCIDVAGAAAAAVVVVMFSAHTCPVGALFCAPPGSDPSCAAAAEQTNTYGI
jgi:hypothetical protein